eukprot:TRINITY_DN4730_c0_g1_i1.p1 TRINITY_DN4730_c0_g1~~TRINITY_DN4730_c0_g1_i1.p1  ORF type:complete len:363 (-),score=40.79 TRINITY_DN4730_c0_g1_i1:240-1328(-)
MFFGWLWTIVSRTVVLVRGFYQQLQAEKREGVDSTVLKTIDDYVSLHDGEEAKRNANYTWFVNAYYNVSTLFYEWAWGSSFHFAPTKKFDTFRSAILRHEFRLADRLRIKKGDKVLDIGCGIGGPLINIARNTGAHITGLNNNAYQITRANALLKEAGLQKTCNFVKGNFCEMPLADDTYDQVYAIESTCHAPTRQAVFAEVFRVLKPGGHFGIYEWVLTEKHDPQRREHAQAAKNIEIGNGLPSTASYRVVPQALQECGFEVIEMSDFFDNKSGDELPWYRDLEGSYARPSTFQFTGIGRPLLMGFLTMLEKIGLAPKGTCKVSKMLHIGAEGLVAGGKMGTFTPGYFFLARKPEFVHGSD